jgi:hypothetical protein
MRSKRFFRIVLGIITAILACLCCVGVPGSFLMPKGLDTVAEQLLESVLMAMGYAAVAAGFAYLSRWCFTGRGFKQRN